MPALFQTRGLNMQNNKIDLIKWLRILLYFESAALVFSLLDYIPIGFSLFTWLIRICQIGTIVCLFGVTFAGKRYLAAAILGSIQLILTVAQSVIIFFFNLLLLWGIVSMEDFEAWSSFCAVLSLIAMVAGWIYTYQYYHANGDLIKKSNPSLCRKWYHLFFWNLLIGIGITISSMIFSTIYRNMGLNNQTLLTLFYSLIKIPNQIIMLMGVLYLHRTIQIIERKEE
jgi:hypothetical protein